MSKERSGKQVRHLKNEIKRLQAEIKRLKREPLDKDEELSSIRNEAITLCEHCGDFAYQVEIVGKPYWRCINCGRTKRV